MSDVKIINDSVLGKLVPAQGPVAHYLSDEDDFDLALYVDGPVLMMKLELDWPSYLNPGSLIMVEKEFVVGGNFLEAFGRGALVNKFEEIYDTVAATQMSFVNMTKIIQVRNCILTLLEEYFEKVDAGVYEQRIGWVQEGDFQ